MTARAQNKNGMPYASVIRRLRGLHTRSVPIFKAVH